MLISIPPYVYLPARFIYSYNKSPCVFDKRFISCEDLVKRLAAGSLSENFFLTLKKKMFGCGVIFRPTRPTFPEI